MSALVALDAGTTGVRAIAFDEEGRPTESAYRPLGLRYPRPGWVEQDALAIWDLAVAVLAEVAAQLAERREAVVALGVANQRETALAWDRSDGRPLHEAIVWQDRRTAARCEQLAGDGALGEVRERTGLVLDPYFSATKFEWLLTEGGVPRRPSVALGTVDAWLLWRMTAGAVFATDATNASRTMLFDIRRLRWTPDLCDRFGVPRSSLPEVRPSCGRFGRVAGELAEAAPALAGVPVSGVAGDQQAALFGQACHRPGLAKATYGTGTFVLLHVGASCPPPAKGVLTTVAWDLGGRGGLAPADRVAYALEGSDLASGAALDWLRDGLGLAGSPAELERLATSVDDSGGVVTVPALAGLGSPWWDARARGTVVGLTRGSGRAELARSVVEAMAFSVRDIVEAMHRATAHRVAELRVDGGVAAMELLLRLQALQLGVEVVRPRCTESTAFGAALLAGLAEGAVADLDDAGARWHEELRVGPAPDDGRATLAHEAWTRAVARARGWEHPPGT